MIRVIGQFRLPADRLAEAREPMRRVVAATLAEPGCRGYSYAEDICDPGLIRVSEAWESRAALDAHFASDHMARWRDERTELGLTERDIRMIEIAGEEPL